MLNHNEISSIWIIYIFAVVGMAHGAYNIASVSHLFKTIGANY
jgi:hypothetical protein